MEDQTNSCSGKGCKNKRTIIHLKCCVLNDQDNEFWKTATVGKIREICSCGAPVSHICFAHAVQFLGSDCIEKKIDQIEEILKLKVRILKSMSMKPMLLQNFVCHALWKHNFAEREFADRLYECNDLSRLKEALCILEEY